MRYAASASVGTLVWAALLACCLKTDYTVASSDEPSMVPKSLEDSSSQLESSMTKRDWNRNLHSWGKRAWQNLQGGWGKRDSSYPLYYPYADNKRAWQNLQGAWGKRLAPEDEYAMKQLASLIEQEEEQQEPQYSEYAAGLAGPSDSEVNTDDKRAWKALNGGWGKRSDSWGNFRGSWGKRDPAWTNLKGIWGKRSYPDRIAQ